MRTLTVEDLGKYYEVVSVAKLPEDYPVFALGGGVNACFIDDLDVNGIVLVAPAT